MFLGKMTRAGIGMIAALGLSTSIASAQGLGETMPPVWRPRGLLLPPVTHTHWNGRSTQLGRGTTTISSMPFAKQRAGSARLTVD